MTEETAIDKAHAAMQAAPEDGAARLRFYQCLADEELFLLLAGEAGEDSVEPALVEVDGARCIVAFDREERLADFAERSAPYAALPGRGLVAMLEGQGLGIALNPEVAPSQILLPAEAVDWLAQTLAPGPEGGEARARELRAPGLEPEIVQALDARLARAGGLASRAYLSGIVYENGDEGHILAIVDAAPGAENAMARAVNEALVFSGREGLALDVAFFAASDEIIERMQRVALRFDLPEPEAPEPRNGPAAPGSDPDKPPILR